MTQPPDPDYAPPSSSSAGANRVSPASPPRRGCLRAALSALGWLLTVALSVIGALAAAAAIAYLVFGFTLATPAQIRQGTNDLAVLQNQAQTLQTEVARLSAAENAGVSELSSARERIDELEVQVAGFEQQAAELASQAATAAALAQDLNENVALAATIQAEGREGQLLVAVVATVQADNAARLAEVERRSDRLSRFLQRLGDLASDAALDSNSPLPSESTTPVSPSASTAAPLGTITATTGTAATTSTPTITPTIEP